MRSRAEMPSLSVADVKYEDRIVVFDNDRTLWREELESLALKRMI
jgi:hypothetical protein